MSDFPLYDAISESPLGNDGTVAHLAGQSGIESPLGTIRADGTSDGVVAHTVPESVELWPIGLQIQWVKATAYYPIAAFGMLGDTATGTATEMLNGYRAWGSRHFEYHWYSEYFPTGGGWHWIDIVDSQSGSTFMPSHSYSTSDPGTYTDTDGRFGVVPIFTQDVSNHDPFTFPLPTDRTIAWPVYPIQDIGHVRSEEWHNDGLGNWTLWGWEEVTLSNEQDVNAALHSLSSPLYSLDLSSAVASPSASNAIPGIINYKFGTGLINSSGVFVYPVPALGTPIAPGGISSFISMYGGIGYDGSVHTTHMTGTEGLDYKTDGLSNDTVVGAGAVVGSGDLVPATPGTIRLERVACKPMTQFFYTIMLRMMVRVPGGTPNLCYYCHEISVDTSKIGVAFELPNPLDHLSDFGLSSLPSLKSTPLGQGCVGSVVVELLLEQTVADYVATKNAISGGYPYYQV